MAKKIFLVSLALGLMLAGIALASGKQEAAGPSTGTAGAPSTAPSGSAQQATPSTGSERLVLTGSISLKDFPHPTLKSGDKEYELMVPWYVVDQSGLKEGDQVTVEGYTVPGMPRWSAQDAGDADLFVTKATIAGKDYDLSQFRAPMMGGGYGQGYGPGHGFGPGSGPDSRGFGPGYGPGYGPGAGGHGMMGWMMGPRARGHRGWAW